MSDEESVTWEDATKAALKALVEVAEGESTSSIKVDAAIAILALNRGVVPVAFTNRS